MRFVPVLLMVAVVTLLFAGCVSEGPPNGPAAGPDPGQPIAASTPSAHEVLDRLRSDYEQGTPEGLASHCIQNGQEISAIVDRTVNEISGRGKREDPKLFMTMASMCIIDANQNPEFAKEFTRYPPDGKYDFREIASVVAARFYSDKKQ